MKKKVPKLKMIEGKRLALEKALVECLFSNDMHKFEQLKIQLEAISQKTPTLALVHKSSYKTDV
jgi:hypothetical protein